ncbi:MAG TPA: hypothetical protein VJU77_17000 [Chthoniobacterales bacterium]|nr:hypothetical protein [Chthoniobacterales bacterium]
MAGAAPWEKTAGPLGIETNVIFKVNNIVYAGTKSQGVYKSTDNGLSWVAANAGIERVEVSDIIFSGTNLLVATRNECPSLQNVFRSTDNGATWSATTGLAGNGVNSFAIKGGTVWAFFSALPNDSGVARSTDNGNTWQVVPSIITRPGKSIVSDDAIIVAESNFIWRSIDDGATWDLVEQFALTGVSSFAKVGTKLFGAAGTGGFHTSTDNGATWNFETFSGGAVSFSANGSTIYLGATSKVFKSIDFGATWSDVSAGLGHGVIEALLYDGTTLFASTPAEAAGIYRSTNGGASWDPAAAGLPVAKTIRSLISFGADLFAATEGDGIYRSSDHGGTWTKVDPNNSLLAQELVLTFCIKDNALFAGALGGIYKSTDGGATFQRMLNGFPPNIKVTAYSMTVSGGNIVAAVNVEFSVSESLAGIFYSSDDGSTWHQANLPVTPTAVTAVASDGSALAYAGVFGQSSSVKGLYKSTDGGVTWTQRQALNVDIERLAANGSNVLAGGLFAAFYSTDFGESWTFSDPPGNCPFGCGIFTYTFRGGAIFAGDAAGMWLSTDSGATWTAVNEGFPQCSIPDVEASAADNAYLFAGTFREGVWRKPMGAPTPTPTPIATATPSPGPSVTPTPTATPSATPIPSATPTPVPTATPGSLGNISTRLRVLGGNNVLIGGMIATGTANKKVIIRAIGPSLNDFGVPGALQDPTLELYLGNTLLTSNDDWRLSPQQVEIQNSGLAPNKDAESAIIATLTPNQGYTAIVRGKNGETGVGLVELFDLEQGSASKLGNISTRGFVDVDDNVMIAGLIVSPSNGTSSKVLVRALGPTLGDFGVPNSLDNPTLDLVNSSGTVIRSNDNWKTDQRPEIEATNLAPNHDEEAALIETVAPGAYTAVVRGSGRTTGVGLVEVYNIQ